MPQTQWRKFLVCLIKFLIKFLHLELVKKEINVNKSIIIINTSTKNYLTFIDLLTFYLANAQKLTSYSSKGEAI